MYADFAETSLGADAAQQSMRDRALAEGRFGSCLLRYVQ
jgi:hypothetical protein